MLQQFAPSIEDRALALEGYRQMRTDRMHCPAKAMRFVAWIWAHKIADFAAMGHAPAAADIRRYAAARAYLELIDMRSGVDRGAAQEARTTREQFWLTGFPAVRPQAPVSERGPSLALGQRSDVLTAPEGVGQ